ncbi:MAG TPA: outer-membrane lipoprotein carrier protein LolA [Methyloceanibacter sp.]|nr:outer-membrane lipoprotein carrier protein LolA [Methyloceanibacter sp.]
MTSCRAAGLLFGLPLAFWLSVGPAPAQDSATTVVKRPPTTTPAAPQGLTEPEDELRPSLGDETSATGTAPPPDEITPTAVDEGAGWEAAVEAAQAATPLIGDEQIKAVERINAYFNNITNLQGSFEQVDATNKRSTGRFYVQRPGKIRFDYAPPSGLRIVADGRFLAIEDADLRTVEKYPIQSTPFRLLLTEAVDLGRDSRIIGVESQEGSLAISLEDKSGDAAGSIRLMFESGSELQLKQWMITDAQGLTTRVTVNDIVSGRKVAADFFTSKESFQPFR